MEHSSRDASVILVAVGLGSNLDPEARAPFTGKAADGRQRALEGAVSGFAAFGWTVIATSGLHESRAEGGADQPDYLNACAVLAAPRRLDVVLAACQGLERAAGRRSKGDGAPRPLDVDLLEAWAPTGGGDWSPSRAEATPALTLPHPRLRQRAFVLVPLREILPLAPGLPAGAVAPRRGQASPEFPRAWSVPAELAEDLESVDPARLSFAR